MHESRADGRLALAPGEVHVWYCWTAACRDPALVARYRSLLSADELARMERFRFEERRHEHLVTRALCRLTLSRYAAVEPAAWQFDANRHGRPEIAAPDPGIPLRFNLSNTSSLVACAVTLGTDVGIDVEETDRRGETVAIAERYFSAKEAAALLALPAEQQRERFFALWTLKEAYIKARGAGLAIPLTRFSFDFTPAIGIGFDEGFDDRADTWHFELHRPGPARMLAVAVRRAPGVPNVIRIRDIVPGTE